MPALLLNSLLKTSRNGMLFISAPVRELIFVTAGYAVGCISTGYYLVRIATGKDIRSIGSGSTGSRNVGRILGKPGFIAALLGDFAKGSLGLWAAYHFRLSPGAVMLVPIAVMAGHIWPVQLGFRGGKGLATLLGIGIVLDYRLALMAASIATLGMLAGLGTASLLVAAVVSPFFAALLGSRPEELAGLAVLVIMVVIAHRSNIRAFFAARRGRKGQLS